MIAKTNYSEMYSTTINQMCTVNVPICACS